MTDACRIEAAAEKIPLLCIQIQQLLIVFRAEIQTGDNGLLQRRGRADRQEIVHLPDPVGDFRRRQSESEPPAGDGISLREGAGADRALPHARQRREINVSVRRIDNVLVDLVRHDKGVIALHDICNDQQFVHRKNLAARIGGVAQNQCLRAAAEGVLEHFRVKMIIRRHQRDINRLGAGEDRIRAVILIEGREDRHFVPRVGDGHHRRHHRFGAAAGDDRLLLRIQFKAHERGLLAAQRFPRIRSAPGDGILMKGLVRDFLQPLQDRPGRIKIRKAL